MTRSASVVLSAALMLLSFTLHGQALESSKKSDGQVQKAADCMAADELLFKLESWSGLREWFESYADCDDGDLAEGVSDYVVVSLAQRWQDLPELKRQIEGNAKFETFVLRHIDATVDENDLQKVVENATRRCPQVSTSLCSSIARAGQEALREIREER